MQYRLAALAAVGFLLCGAADAVAQTSPTPAGASVSAPPTAQTEAKVRRLMAAMHFERQIDTLLGAMLPVMIEQQRQAHPSLSAADEKLIADTTREVMRDKFTPKLIARAIPIYAATYSGAELDAMLAFYESPIGQSVLEKTSSMSPKVAAVTRDLLPEVQAEMIRAMCAKMNCLQPGPAPQSKPKAS